MIIIKCFLTYLFYLLLKFELLKNYLFLFVIVSQLNFLVILFPQVKFFCLLRFFAFVAVDVVDVVVILKLILAFLSRI